MCDKVAGRNKRHTCTDLQHSEGDREINHFSFKKPQFIAIVNECTFPFFFYMFKFLLHH